MVMLAEVAIDIPCNTTQLFFLSNTACRHLPRFQFLLFLDY